MVEAINANIVAQFQSVLTSLEEMIEMKLEEKLDDKLEERFSTAVATINTKLAITISEEQMIDK